MYLSPGFADEECHLFLATDLRDETAEADENERIEIVEAPLAELDGVDRRLPRRQDVIGLLLCARRLRSADARVAASRDDAAAAEPSEPMATIEQPVAERRFEHLVLDFLAYLEFERGLSRNTLEAYRGGPVAVRPLPRGARGVSALDAETGDVADFLEELARGEPRGRPPRPPRSTERAPACAPSTATCAATG